MDESFAPPPFDADQALLLLRRQLRELRLGERGAGYEIKGRRVLDLQALGDHIEARLARRPASTPEWVSHQLKSSADVRRFVDQLKLQLARWSADE